MPIGVYQSIFSMTPRQITYIPRSRGYACWMGIISQFLLKWLNRA